MKLKSIMKEMYKGYEYSKNFELGTPVVYNENGTEYTEEVIMNKEIYKGEAGNEYKPAGSVKGIITYKSNTFFVPDWSKVKKFKA